MLLSSVRNTSFLHCGGKIDVCRHVLAYIKWLKRGLKCFVYRYQIIEMLQPIKLRVGGGGEGVILKEALKLISPLCK